MATRKMKLIIVCLVASVYCSEVDQNVGYKERRIAGGGNYGGFIGLTTYGAGPFLVKGKLERDYNDGRDNRREYQNNNGDFEPKYFNNVVRGKLERDYNDKRENRREYQTNNGYLEPKYVNNVGYDDIVRANDDKGESYGSKEPSRNNEKKDDLEYLGYRSRRGYCIGEYRDRDRYERGNGYRSNIDYNYTYPYYRDEEINRRCDSLFGFNGPNGNDEPQNLVRPCALDDWQCIRKYFAANSDCKPAYGPIPDPLYIDVNTMYFPFSNLTLALPNLVVRGLSSARITEFYANKWSGNLVLSFDVMNLNESSPRVYFRYRRTGKESIVLSDFASSNYRSVTFTVVIPNIPKMRLDLADIHASVQDPAPVHIIGPGVVNSTDPDVITAFGQFFATLPVALNEAMLFQSQLFASMYIQNNICDFGLKLISV